MEEDLNRCFSYPSQAPVYQRARAIRQAIAEVEPECVVDLHNTSGSGPAFAARLWTVAFNQRWRRASIPARIFCDLVFPTPKDFSPFVDNSLQIPRLLKALEL